MSLRPPAWVEPPDALVPPLFGEAPEPKMPPSFLSPPQPATSAPSRRASPSLLTIRMQTFYGCSGSQIACHIDDLMSEARDLFRGVFRREADVKRIDAGRAVLTQRLENLLRRADEPALRPAYGTRRVGVVVRQPGLAVGDEGRAVH